MIEHLISPNFKKRKVCDAITVDLFNWQNLDSGNHLKFLTIFHGFGSMAVYKAVANKIRPANLNQYRGGRVNKLELINNLKDECQISKNEAAFTVDIFFEKISDALAEGDRVEIRGLCSFFVKEYESYRGRNPKTGDTVQVAPKRLPFFKVGKELKERVDY